MSHYEDLVNDSKDLLEAQYKILQTHINKTDLPTMEMFITIYGKILTNSFSLRSDRYVDFSPFFLLTSTATFSTSTFGRLLCWIQYVIAQQFYVWKYFCSAHYSLLVPSTGYTHFMEASFESKSPRCMTLITPQRAEPHNWVRKINPLTNLQESYCGVAALPALLHSIFSAKEMVCGIILIFHFEHPTYDPFPCNLHALSTRHPMYNSIIDMNFYIY